ncbi:ABC transporter permease [Clostridium oceanicum]|uniref:FtsX-like permease family protein n=1 Tax=Clostridium oceanicum TaxID=1543 RepID=A0ABN1JC86_9CLOT
MNVFNKVALQGLKKNRTRTLVTIIGVILSAAMITAVATFGISLLSYMANGAAHKSGNWHVKFLDTPSSFVEKRSKNEKISNSVTFQNIGYAKLKGVEDEKKPYLFLAGFNNKSFDSLPINLISGRLPKNSKEIVIPTSILIRGGDKISIGDTLSLNIGDRISGNKTLGQKDPYTLGKETLVEKDKRTYKIVGISQKPGFQNSSTPFYTLITKADSKYKENSFSLFLTLKNPRSVHSYAKDTGKNYAYEFNDNVLRFMGLSDSNIFNTLLYSVGAIVSIIIMIGSIFLIYNAFNISLNERTHQFGILSSVGATEKQLRNSVLFEGLLISAVGIPIGIIVGLGSIGLVLSVVAKNFSNILYSNVPLTLKISAPAIILAATLSMITILISAYIPARKAASTPVMECIRQTKEIKIQNKTVKISKFAKHIYGLEGILALKNFKRNKKRYRSIVLSLALSILLFISTSSFVTYMKQTSDKAKESFTYDITLSATDMKDNKMLDLYDKLKTTDGVYESSCQKVLRYSSTVKDNVLSDNYFKSKDSHSTGKKVDIGVDLQFINDKTYFNIIKDLGLPLKEYTGKDPKLISVATMKGATTKGNDSDSYGNIFKNSSMNFTIAPKINGKTNTKQGKKVTIKFLEKFVPPDIPPMLKNSGAKSPFFFRIMAPYSMKEKFETKKADVTAKGFTFKSKNPSQSMDKMETLIEAKGITDGYKLLNVHEINDSNRNMIFIANVFSYTFIIMISLIAVANVFNTISTNIKLRRRELAMLRSVGMSEKDFQKMMNFECAFYGIKALLFGLPLSILSSWLIYKGMIKGGAENIHFVFPWISIGISAFTVFIVVFITMLYATDKIKKENIIDALRDDMA